MQNLEQQLNDIECIIESQNNEMKINVKSKPNIVYEITHFEGEVEVPEGFEIISGFYGPETRSVTVERVWIVESDILGH